MAHSTPSTFFHSILQPAIDQGQLAGAVALAATRTGIRAVETIGYADLAADTPMAENSLFWIASQTKPITATALMILVDEGRVGLDDPVEKHLPTSHGARRCRTKRRRDSGRGWRAESRFHAPG